MKRRDKFLPFHSPSITDAEIRAVVEALQEGWVSSGPRVQQFEEEFAKAVGVAHTVAVNSCTAALHLSLEALGVGQGDEVIVPVMTFAATAAVAIHLGARPVFIDCHHDSLLMDETKLLGTVTPRTKAIVPVHYGGQACEMDPILKLARRRGIKIVEDAAHAFPASYRGRGVGTLGDAAAFSFYASKPLATGEGVMITTSDEDLAARARLMRVHGIVRGESNNRNLGGNWRYRVEAAGYKCNMPELQAAQGLVQLRRREELLALRAAIARRYMEGLADLEAVQLPPVLPEREHSWHLFVIKLQTEQLSIDRDRFIEELNERNIGASVHFVPLHRQPFYEKSYGLREEDFPGAESAWRRIVSLPIWPGMSERDVDDVIEAVREICGGV